MGSNWEEVALGNIFSVKHGFAFKGKYFTDTPQKTILVTPGNFAVGGGFQNPKPKYYNGPYSEEYVLMPGQVVITMTDLSKASDTLGYAAVIPDDGNIWLHNQRIGLVELIDESRADLGFIHYLLRTHEYRAWIIGSASGTTVKHTSPSRIEEYRCKIPPLPEQRAIAHILGTLDDKIELNRQMNRTLEAMAQALFKSWFIDFDPVVVNALRAGNPIPEKFAQRAAHYRDTPNALRLPEDTLRKFPDRFQDSELGPIPEGWNATTIGAEFDLTMGQSPPSSTYNEKGEGLPFFQGSRDFGFRYPSNRVYCNAPTRIAHAGDTLVSVRAPVGDINMAYETCCVGRGVAAIRHKSESRSYTYYAMKALGERFKRFEAEGTVFGSINKKQFQNLPSMEVEPNIVAEFEKLASSIDENIQSFDEEMRTLSKLRDTLLPKLISGEMRVSDAENLLEDVG